MADYWSMEVPAAHWMPYDHPLANWTAEPAAYALGFPSMEYASTDMLGSSCYQTSITICDEEQQCGYEIVTRYDPNESTTQQESVVTVQSKKTKSLVDAVLQDVADTCNKDADVTHIRMHRYPASIQALCLDGRFTTPKVVAIGPYYRKCERLQQAQKMKYVAVNRCVKGANDLRLKPVYEKFAPVADHARRLYDHDSEVAGMDYHEFRDMMFVDACFLVQYIFLRADYESRARVLDPSLLDFFDTNDNDIFHDIMLLENQIPWSVVESIIKSTKNSKKYELLDTFIDRYRDCLIDLKSQGSEGKCCGMYPNSRDGYKPPHLLGLLRYYIVGRNKTMSKSPEKVDDTISFSVGAVELAEIGVNLKANENCRNLIHMGVNMKCFVGGELFLAPVTLDDARASCLVSMAALELCTVPNFQGDKLDQNAEPQSAQDTDSAVCSYLLLLAMLVAREEDVQKLREKHVLLGGGLADKEVLDFVTKLHDLRLGTCYVRVMKQIAHYQRERRTRIAVYSFLYNNWKYISALCSVIAGTGIVSKLVNKYF